MKCDDYLAFLETGTAWQRRQATRHARNCPSCAAAGRMLDELKSEMAEAVSLPGELRERWLAAATGRAIVEVAPRSSFTRTAWYAVAFAIAAMLLVALVPLLRRWGGDESPVARRDTERLPKSQQHAVPRSAEHTLSEISVSQIDRGAELHALDALVAGLRGDLDQLISQSERLAAQQQLNQLLASHQRWQTTGL